MPSTSKPPLPKSVFIGLGMAGVIGLFMVLDPAGLGLPWKCRFNQFTGLYCPGCGATRATRNLLRGEVALAFRQNMLLIPLMLAGMSYALWGFFRYRHNKPLPRIPAIVWWIVGVTTVVYGVWRNL